MHEPVIIQGGMGAGVSMWKLARAVSRLGQLGVVSGTAIDAIVARRLQVGDPGGHCRRALAHFPFPAVARRVIDEYFIEGGKAPDAPFKSFPVAAVKPSQRLLELTVSANFVEVFLAKEGHDGQVGINYLEKIQLPTLPSIFGAMLAGVDRVLMGAGIPRLIPGILDGFADGNDQELPIVVGDEKAGAVSRFSPRDFCGGPPPALRRPAFLAIVASAVLAGMLAKKANGRVDGFIVEGPTAGGHNAPPRGQLQLTAEGEPIYGRRDVVDLADFRDLGRPFWLAGSYGCPERLQEALAEGAAGVQVGTAFAYCEESGIAPELKQQVIDRVLSSDPPRIITDARASPTGFPFKILAQKGTMQDDEVYANRTRICDLGYLRQAYRKEDGSVSWRCPSEPIAHWARKGGDPAETDGRKCVCNGLMATIGLGQVRRGVTEAPLITSGDDIPAIKRFIPEGATSYGAEQVVKVLLGQADSRAEVQPRMPMTGELSS
jgi:nitronate monooxygenase